MEASGGSRPHRSFTAGGRAKDYIEKKLAKYLDPKADPAQLPTNA